MKRFVSFFSIIILITVLAGCASTGYYDNDYGYRRVPNYQHHVYIWPVPPPVIRVYPPPVYHQPRPPVYYAPPFHRLAPQVRPYTPPPVHRQPQIHSRPPTVNRPPAQSIPRSQNPRSLDSRSPSTRYKR